MSEYMVLYHDPVRLHADEAARWSAAHSVWVCRDDRYAFEVHLFVRRPHTGGAAIFATWGEARVRLAMALEAAARARLVAAADGRRRDPVVVECDACDVLRHVASIDASCHVNFGDVIDRFDLGTPETDVALAS